MFWSIWALVYFVDYFKVQADGSDIEFDYMNYAVMRYDDYHNRKKQFFNLNLDNI